MGEWVVNLMNLDPEWKKQTNKWTKKNSSETELSDDVDQWLIAFGTTRQNELCQKSGCEFIKKEAHNLWTLFWILDANYIPK